MSEELPGASGSVTAEAGVANMDISKLPVRKIATNVPVIYADFIRGAMTANGILKFNLVQVMMDLNENGVDQQHVATIALPVSQAAAWGEFLIKTAASSQEETTDVPS